MDFEIKRFARIKEGHFIVIRGSIHQEIIIIINTDAPNKKAEKHIEQKLAETEIDIAEGETDHPATRKDANIPLTQISRTSMLPARLIPDTLCAWPRVLRGHP